MTDGVYVLDLASPFRAGRAVVARRIDRDRVRCSWTSANAPNGRTWLVVPLSLFRLHASPVRRSGVGTSAGS